MENKLKQLREDIDNIDKKIISCLSERMQRIVKIAQIKKEDKLEIFDHDREKVVKSKIKDMLKAKGLSDDFVLDIYEIIIKESKRIQNEIIKEN